MKKSILKILFVSSLSVVLSACSFSTASENPNVFTVSYYDDSATPVLVGYAYVIGGRAANMKAVDGVSYDRLSHAGRTPSAVGNHFVFDGFAGTYDDGSEVDLDAITGNCSVYAQFVEETYSVSYTFKNGAVSLRDDDGELIKGYVEYGDTFSFSSLGVDESTLSYSVPRYGYDYSLSGFYLASDSSEAGITDSSLKWESGASLPETVSDAGHFFVSTEAMDNNPEYKTYYSNGTEWKEIGSLSKNLSLVFSASYEETEKEFTVSIMKDDALIGTISAYYGKEAITVTEDSGKLKFSNSRSIFVEVEGTNYSAKYIKYSEATKDKIQENYSEKAVELAHIMGDCVITVD